MKKILADRIISVVLMMSVLTSSINTFVLADENKLTAFPGAEGGGMYTQGARAGSTIEVYHVTNLNDSGAGSFRDAVSQGNRIIVFDVAGNIMLESELYITASNLTILGQTAPGEGICVGGESVRFGSCSNVILRYMRFRMGDNSFSQEDGLGVRKSTDFIIDHCSIEWSVDECLSAYENKNFTAQYCIISESLNSSVHGKGEHGYGGIWGGINASFHHNLISTHKARMPRIGSSETVSTYEGRPDTDSLIDIRNNVVYNYRSTIGYGGENGTRVNFVNNYYKPTKFSSQNVSFYTAYGTRGTTLYLEGNYMEGDANFNNNNWTRAYTDEDLQLKSISEGITVDGVLKANDEYIYDYPVTTVTAQEAYDDVIKNAGASVVRDYTDTRVVNDVINGTYPTGSNGSSGLIDTQSDVGGWNSLYGKKAIDSDNDGIPDEWEDKNGLNKNNPSDSVIIGANGYTNIENYANDIVSTNHNSTDKTKLWEAMSKVEKLNSADYFEELWLNVEAAYKNGIAVRERADASQRDIDLAAEDINAALDTLQRDERTALTTAIAKAEALDKNQYTAESWQAVDSGIQNGKVVLADEYNEEKILQAVTDIETAVNKLVISSRVELMKAIDKYSAYDNDDWTRDSYNAFRNEIENAKSIYGNFNYTEQGYIAEINTLKATFDALEPIYNGESEVLDFEDMAVGEYEDSYTHNNFKFYPSTYYQSSKFNVVDFENSKVFLAKLNNVQISRIYDEPLKGVYCAEADCLMTDSKGGYTLFELYNNHTKIYISKLGNVIFEVGTDSTILMKAEADRWYNIKAVVDADNKTISVYIDGKLVKENIPVQEKDIMGFLFVENSYYTGKLYCDNVKITKRIYPEILYGDADCDGNLTSNDSAVILQKVLKFDYIMPVENVVPDLYMKYIDVDLSGQLTSSDAAYVLAKVLKADFVMPAEGTTAEIPSESTTAEPPTETSTVSTTQTSTVTEDSSETSTSLPCVINFDDVPAGSYNSPLNLPSMFAVNNSDGGNIVITERPITYGGVQYTNAIDGSLNEINFTLRDNVRLMVIASTNSTAAAYHIKGVLEDGTAYDTRRVVEPAFGDEEYYSCSMMFNLPPGQYTLNCERIMVNCIKTG